MYIFHITVLNIAITATIHVWYKSTDITVSFNQSSYIANEDEGPAEPVLVLSNPSSTDIIVVVTQSDMSGSGNDMPSI